MKYKQALTIGTSEGVVQCTYAIIYDKDGKKVFAFQRKNFDIFSGTKSFLQPYLQDGNNSYAVNNDQLQRQFATYLGYGEEGIVGWDGGNIIVGDVATGYITFDMPLVAAEKWSGERLVPVKLLFPAIAYIKRTLESSNPISWWSLVDEQGERIGEPTINTKLVKQWMDEGKMYTTFKDYAPQWKKLINGLNDKETYYIKPAAFNWQPIATDHLATNYGEYQSEQLKAAKERLDKAKRILIAAGAGALI